MEDLHYFYVQKCNVHQSKAKGQSQFVQKKDVSCKSRAIDTVDCESCDNVVTHEQMQIECFMTHVQVNLEAEARTPILGQMKRDRNYKGETRLIVTYPECPYKPKLIRTIENG